MALQDDGYLTALLGAAFGALMILLVMGGLIREAEGAEAPKVGWDCHPARVDPSTLYRHTTLPKEMIQGLFLYVSGLEELVKGPFDTVKLIAAPEHTAVLLFFYRGDYCGGVRITRDAVKKAYDDYVWSLL